MSMRTPWLVAGAAVALYASAALAAEQSPGKDPHRMERREVRIYRHGGPEMMAMNPEARAAHIGTMLQLRPDQESALKAFLDAMAPPHVDPDKVIDDAHHSESRPTTPERLEMMETRLAWHTSAVQGRIAATRKFYAKLDTKQQKVFDAMPMLMMAGPGMDHHKAMRIMHHMPGPEMPPPPPPHS